MGFSNLYEDNGRYLPGPIFDASLLIWNIDGLSTSYTKGKLQDETGGYLDDLQVYIKDEDGKAHRPDERDMMPL